MVKKVLIALVVLVILAVAYYALSPLFNVIEIDDALPETTQQELNNDSDLLEPTTEAGGSATGNTEGNVPGESPPPAQPTTPSSQNNTGSTDTTPSEAANEPVSFVSAASKVMGTAGHPAQGDVVVVRLGSDTTIRYENFETINGPNLHVYLAKDLEAKEFIDLGEIRGTKGNINYKIPAHINIDEWKYVMYWCVPFGVLFNYAELN